MSKRKGPAKEDQWQNLEYWIKRNPDKSIEECKVLLENKMKHFREAKKNRIDYWVKNYPDRTLEECQAMCDKYKKETNWQHVEYWMKKYPEKSMEECEAMRKARIDESVKKHPDISGENNPRHRSKVSYEELQACSPNSIKFWQRKYPEKTEEECQILLKEYRERLKLTHTPENTSTCIEYWLAKGYSEEEAKEKLIERQRTFSLEHCIEKYGKEGGEKVFKERQERWQKSLKKHWAENGDGRSVQSEFAKNIIHLLCDSLNINVPEKEKWIYNKDIERGYAYDFTYNNKIIEFNGDYWHANPYKYDADFYNKSKKMTAEEIWLYDKMKKECAEKHGYKVMVVWESDWNEDPEGELNKCIKFLND